MADHQQSVAGKPRSKITRPARPYWSSSTRRGRRETENTKTGRRSTLPVFGVKSVPETLPFHPHANITAVEYAVFFPEFLRSRDLVDRLIINGGNVQVLKMMINYHRVLPRGPITNNTLCKLIQGAMRDYHEGWTVTGHKNGKFHTGNSWLPNDLTMTGKKTRYQKYLEHSGRRGGQEDVDILLRSLANNVRYLPNENTGDGFELTRAVKFALANPHLKLMFIRDFIWLNDYLGPLSVELRHHDSALFLRWTFDVDDEQPTTRQLADQKAKLSEFKCTSKQEHDIVEYLAKVDSNKSKSGPVVSTASESVSEPEHEIEDTSVGNTEDFFPNEPSADLTTDIPDAVSENPVIPDWMQQLLDHSEESDAFSSQDFKPVWRNYRFIYERPGRDFSPGSESEFPHSQDQSTSSNLADTFSSDATNMDVKLNHHPTTTSTLCTEEGEHKDHTVMAFCNQGLYHSSGVDTNPQADSEWSTLDARL